MDNQNSNSQQPTQFSAPNSVPTQMSKPKLPWPWWSVLLFSVIFGLPGSYFIVWQNLKRINQKQKSDQFLLIGGVMIIVLNIILFLLPFDLSLLNGFNTGLSLIFPVWFYVKHLNRWQKENIGKAKFNWPIVGWGALGLIIYLILFFVLSLI